MIGESYRTTEDDFARWRREAKNHVEFNEKTFIAKVTSLANTYLVHMHLRNSDRMYRFVLTEVPDESNSMYYNVILSDPGDAPTTPLETYELLNLYHNRILNWKTPEYNVSGKDWQRWKRSVHDEMVFRLLRTIPINKEVSIEREGNGAYYIEVAMSRSKQNVLTFDKDLIPGDNKDDVSMTILMTLFVQNRSKPTEAIADMKRLLVEAAEISEEDLKTHCTIKSLPHESATVLRVQPFKAAAASFPSKLDQYLNDHLDGLYIDLIVKLPVDELLDANLSYLEARLDHIEKELHRLTNQDLAFSPWPRHDR